MPPIPGAEQNGDLIVDVVAEAESLLAAGDTDTEEVSDPSSFETSEDLLSFNDEAAEEATDSETNDEGEKAEEEANPDAEGKITYKANDQDVTISVEEAKRRLAMQDGTRKVFSENHKLKKQLEKKTKEANEGREIRDLWQKLEAVKDDDAALYKLITGRDFQSRLDAEVEKREAYRNASPEEQRALEAQWKAEEAERQLERERRNAKKLSEATEKEKEQLQKTRLYSYMETEFNNYKLPEGIDPGLGNDLREMLWVKTVQDIKVMKRKDENTKITPSVLKQLFSKNFAAIQATYTKVGGAETKKAAAAKEKEATEKAQKASTKNYPKTNPVDKELLRKNPLDLFHALRKSK